MHNYNFFTFHTRFIVHYFPTEFHLQVEKKRKQPALRVTKTRRSQQIYHDDDQPSEIPECAADEEGQPVKKQCLEDNSATALWDKLRQDLKEKDEKIKRKHP